MCCVKVIVCTYFVVQALQKVESITFVRFKTKSTPATSTAASCAQAQDPCCAAAPFLSRNDLCIRDLMVHIQCWCGERPRLSLDARQTQPSSTSITANRSRVGLGASKLLHLIWRVGHASASQLPLDTMMARHVPAALHFTLFEYTTTLYFFFEVNFISRDPRKWRQQEADESTHTVHWHRATAV